MGISREGLDFSEHMSMLIWLRSWWSALHLENCGATVKARWHRHRYVLKRYINTVHTIKISKTCNYMVLIVLKHRFLWLNICLFSEVINFYLLSEWVENNQVEVFSFPGKKCHIPWQTRLTYLIKSPLAIYHHGNKDLFLLFYYPILGSPQSSMVKSKNEWQELELKGSYLAD